MKLIVQRRWPDAQCVIGEMLDGIVHLCYTMEPPYAVNVVKPRAIPAGTYNLTIRFSPRFARLMPHIEDVPGFDGILIHWGNFPADTDGCCLVGDLIGTNFIGHSRTEFDTLFLQLNDAIAQGQQTITFIDPPSGPFMYPDVDGEIET